MLISPVSKIAPSTFSSKKNRDQQRNESWDAVFEEVSKQRGISPSTSSKENCNAEPFSLGDGGVGTLEDFLRRRTRLAQVTTKPTQEHKSMYLERAKMRGQDTMDLVV